PCPRPIPSPRRAPPPHRVPSRFRRRSSAASSASARSPMSRARSRLLSSTRRSRPEDSDMRFRIVALLALAGLGVLAIHPGGGLSAAETREVQIDNYSFAPGTLTVPAGTTVTWVNHDETVHTVTAVDNARSFKSGGLDTDDKFSFTFTKAGTYSYVCTVHPY